MLTWPVLLLGGVPLDPDRALPAVHRPSVVIKVGAFKGISEPMVGVVVHAAPGGLVCTESGIVGGNVTSGYFHR